jgi:hypothetical protein
MAESKDEENETKTITEKTDQHGGRYRCADRQTRSERH